MDSCYMLIVLEKELVKTMVMAILPFSTTAL